MLNPTQVKNLKLKPGNKITKIRDIENLYLHIKENGSKFWWFRYYTAGKEKGLSIGTFPGVTLKEAREKALELKDLHRKGVNLAELKKAEKASSQGNTANSFEAVAREWWSVMKSDKAESHKGRILVSLEKDVFPWIGTRPVNEVTGPELVDIARRIENRGAVETAHRVIGRCGEVILYAIATGRAENDPTPAAKKALRPVVVKHMAAITEPEKVGELLRVIYGYRGTLVVNSALKLAPLLFVRPGELRQAEWKDFDLDKAQWCFTASKTAQNHLVPLSRQALEILRELQPATGNGRYVFPAPTSKDRPMSNNAILAAFRRMGITTDEMSGHGWRATARTLLDEVLHFPVPVIEMQLAHTVKDMHGRAYNRTTFIDQRREMMQAWADYLEELRGNKP